MKQSSPARHPEYFKLCYCDHIYHQHRHRRCHYHHHLLETRLWIQHFKKQELNYYYYYRIFHFSALAGKYSPILGCSDQQD